MTKYSGFSRPPQKIPTSEKTDDWYKDNIDSIASLTTSTFNSYRSSYKQKKVCYDALNSIVDIDDPLYSSFTNPYGDKSVGKQPGVMMNINMIANKVNALRGDEMSRPFDYQVIGLNGGAVSAREEKRKELLVQATIAEIAKELGVSLEPQIDPQTGEEIPITFPQVDKFMNYSYVDIREKMCSDILRYLEYEQKIHAKFSEGFEHVLAAGEEIYKVEIVNDEPVVRVVNPMSFEFDFNPDDPIIENGDVFREERVMSVGQIIDEFRDYLKDSDIAKLDTGDVFRSNSRSQYPGFAYTMDTLNQQTTHDRVNNTNTAITVVYCTWKGMKQIGFVTYPDENGVPQSGIVSEEFKLDNEMKEAGYELEWKYIPVFYSGVRIGSDIYCKMGPEEVQFRSLDNPSKVKGPYIGRVFNANNSKQTSYVEFLLPYARQYDIVWYKLMQELAKAKGKKMVMDIAQIPKSEGFDLDKWMYMFDNIGVAFINSFEEGKGSNSGKSPNFNQFTDIDLTLSQSVGQYINILTKLEQLIDKVSGVSPQREGSTFASETASGNQSAINMSSYITEPIFYAHNEVKKSVLESLLEAAKIAYPDNKKLHYILDDQTRVMLNLDMEKIPDSDYGIFISNSPRDIKALNDIKSIAAQSASSGTPLSDIAKIIKAQSSIEIIKALEDAEMKREQIQQEQSQQQERITQMNIEAAKEEKEAERQFLAEQNQLDRDAELRGKIITTMGFDTDTQDNNQIDVLKQGELALKESNALHERIDKYNQRNHESAEKEKDRELKRQEIKSKEKNEALKARVALKNKVVGEK